MEAGKKIGRYEVRSKIGAGGMGEVYLAHDAALGRDVALKVLPAEFSGDAERLTRFRQEARAVSALNHPNIMTIYEIGESADGWFIATELVSGETLRETISREKSLSVKQALKIAEQIADALASAHEAGIVHRDIKPENLMIRRDGYLKVLDFGLAKPTQIKSAPEDATLQIVNTTPGIVMGSVRYMSPEQARGRDIDERTDLWSLGVVLYEMIIGKPPFAGETTSDTIAALIYQDVPQILAAAPDAPPEINRIVRKALRKDKSERYQTAKDFAVDLRSLRADLERDTSGEIKTAVFAAHSTTAPHAIHQTNSASQTAFGNSANVNATVAGESAGTGKIVKRSGRTAIFFALGAIAAAVLLGIGWLQFFRAKPNLAATVFDKPQITKLATDGKVRIPAISPDGKYVAFVSGEIGSRSLVVRQIAADSLITLILPTARQIVAVDFAPDGNFIYYVLRDKGDSIGTLFRIPTLGGESTRIIEDVDSRVSFSPDSRQLVFLRHVSNDGSDLIITVNVDGTNPEQFLSSKSTDYNFFGAPAWSPDGEKFLISVDKQKDGLEGTRIAEITRQSKNIRLISEQKWYNASDLQWLRDGSGFTFVGSDSSTTPSQIWSVSYPDAAARRITNDTSQYSFFSAAANNAAAVGVVTTVSASLWTYAPLNKELAQLTAENRTTDGGSGITQTPDGKIFYTRNEENEVNIYKSDEDGKNAVKLTSNAKYNLDLNAAPDGRYVVFISNRSGVWRVWRMDADGKNAVQLSNGENVGDSRPTITADGSTVVFSRQIGNNGRAFIMQVPLAGGAAKMLSLDEQSYDAFPRVAPDGKSIAYVSFNSATPGLDRRLLVREYADGALGKIKFSGVYDLTDNFRWAPDGKSLTLLRSEGTPNLWQLSLENGKISPLTTFTSGRIFYFSWSSDGRKLFVVRGNVNNDLILVKDDADSSTK